MKKRFHFPNKFQNLKKYRHIAAGTLCLVLAAVLLWSQLGGDVYKRQHQATAVMVMTELSVIGGTVMASELLYFRVPEEGSRVVSLNAGSLPSRV